MKFTIKNRIFQIGKVDNQTPTFLLDVLSFWMTWNVKSFTITILNIEFQTWNPSRDSQ